MLLRLLLVSTIPRQLSPQLIPLRVESSRGHVDGVQQVGLLRNERLQLSHATRSQVPHLVARHSRLTDHERLGVAREHVVLRRFAKLADLQRVAIAARVVYGPERLAIVEMVLNARSVQPHAGRLLLGGDGRRSQPEVRVVSVTDCAQQVVGQPVELLLELDRQQRRVVLSARRLRFREVAVQRVQQVHFAERGARHFVQRSAGVGDIGQRKKRDEDEECRHGRWWSSVCVLSLRMNHKRFCAKRSYQGKKTMMKVN